MCMCVCVLCVVCLGGWVGPLCRKKKISLKLPKEWQVFLAVAWIPVTNIEEPSSSLTLLPILASY